jgi:methionyl-tRNA synthetase
MTKPAYVTTTIPYVNAPPHIGFALELVQADAIARYHRLLGREVRLQSGTDENAFKNVLSAEARGIHVQHSSTRTRRAFARWPTRSTCRSTISSAPPIPRIDEPSTHSSLGFGPTTSMPADYRGLYCTGARTFIWRLTQSTAGARSTTLRSSRSRNTTGSFA